MHKPVPRVTYAISDSGESLSSAFAVDAEKIGMTLLESGLTIRQANELSIHIGDFSVEALHAIRKGKRVQDRNFHRECSELGKYIVPQKKAEIYIVNHVVMASVSKSNDVLADINDTIWHEIGHYVDHMHSERGNGTYKPSILKSTLIKASAFGADIASVPYRLATNPVVSEHIAPSALRYPAAAACAAAGLLLAGVTIVNVSESLLELHYAMDQNEIFANDYANKHREIKVI